ncbi:hypothetical protein [Streptomyces sp. OE57]|uniref:hypothetical protein n=1 Tax=Streptomyces lacaronensis TaxID=3379885 RepID=UPI0039B77495
MSSPAHHFWSRPRDDAAGPQLARDSRDGVAPSGVKGRMGGGDLLGQGKAERGGVSGRIRVGHP